MSSRGAADTFTARRLRATLSDTEQSIRNRPTEVTHVYDKYGNEIYTGHGTSDSTALPMSEARNWSGATVTHNHPQGTSFSKHDVLFAHDANLAEMRAVGPNYRYSLRPPKGGWDKLSTVWGPLDKQIDSSTAYWTNRLGQDYRAGKISQQDAQQQINHNVMRSIAETTGLVYRRTAWK